MLAAAAASMDADGHHGGEEDADTVVPEETEAVSMDAVGEKEHSERKDTWAKQNDFVASSQFHFRLVALLCSN